MIERFRSLEKGLPHINYWNSNCKQCALKSSCTTIYQRRIKRWENEVVLDQMQSNLESMPIAMKIRRHHRTHLWYLEILDECFAFLDEDQSACHYRNEPTYSGIQHEASNKHNGKYVINECDGCVRSTTLLCFKIASQT